MEETPANKKRIVIAIDTNVINLKCGIKEMNELEKLHAEGLIEIVIPASISGEIKDYRIEAWNKINKYRWVRGAGFYDNRILYGTMKFGSPEPEYSQLKSIIFPKGTLGNNNQRDLVHLIACIRNDVDYFITNEEAIYKNKAKIMKTFNITATDPGNILKELEGKIS
jgi:hypothetical protein